MRGGLVAPEEALSDTITYTSSDEAVATVDADDKRKTQNQTNNRQILVLSASDPCGNLPRSKNAPQGHFCRPGRGTAGASCSIPALLYSPKVLYKEKRSTSYEVERLGDPCGNRTHVNGVRGRCLNRLTNGP